MRPARLAVVLLAHGSRDPRAAEATRALTAAVAGAHPSWRVHDSYLDHAGPRPLDVLTALSEAGHRRAVLVPLLLTAAYHGRIDVPAVVSDARTAGLHLDVRLADVLGSSPEAPALVPELLLDALTARLPGGPLDAVVLVAAGTRNAAARVTVSAAAQALGVRLGLPCTVAYASAAPPTGAEAVAALRAAGARRIGVASYFLAPGLLYDTVVASARSAGAVVSVAEPLADTGALVDLVAARVAAVHCRRSRDHGLRSRPWPKPVRAATDPGPGAARKFSRSGRNGR